MGWGSARCTAALLLVLGITTSLWGAEGPMLPLEKYLGEVREKNQAVRGSIEAEKASVERRAEKELPLSPTLFANVMLSADAKLPQLPFFLYDQINGDTYALGVSQQTTFGLQAKLSYELDYTSFINPSLPGAPTNFPSSFYDARPMLELTQSVWGDGFGRTVRAARDLVDAQTRVAEYTAKFQGRNLMLQAESAYWRLAVARASVQIEEQALSQAKEIYDYTLRREKTYLGEVSDTLQAKAAWELRNFELRAAKDEVRVASRALNVFRNLRSSDVTEELSPVTTDTVRNLAPPARAKLRDDVAAAAQQVAATSANTTIAVEKDKPTFDIFGSYALNGRDDAVGGALGNSYNAQRPTKMIGAKLTIPLDRGSAEEARHGAIRDRNAAEMMYQQKLEDQEQAWTDLVERLEEAKERLALTETIEKAQQEKMANERRRLTVGRTTTYQVLLFEQDLSQSQLTRLHVQADVLGIYTQMKLFSGETP